MFPQYKTDITNRLCVSGADSGYVVSDGVGPCVSFGDSVVAAVVANSDHETGYMLNVASARTAQVSGADERCFCECSGIRYCSC